MLWYKVEFDSINKIYVPVALFVSKRNVRTDPFLWKYNLIIM